VHDLVASAGLPEPLAHGRDLERVHEVTVSGA
jgi:hypothetical protein